MINEIVTVMTATGEYVGKLMNMDGGNILLKDPRLITFTENGMGFANGIAATGIQNPKEVTITQAIFFTETNPDVAKAWRQATSGIVLP